MKRISFDGIVNKIGEEITILLDVGNRQIAYKQKLIGTDSEHLIFEEGKGKAYVSKNRIVEYN